MSAIPSHIRHQSKASGDYSDPTLVLQKDAAKAISMIKRMTTPPTSESPKANNIIPLDFIRRCKGIQFISTKLGGLVVSVQRGSSFTIQRITDEAGNTTWSGPVFSTISNIGIGLTAGYDALDTIVILGNAATVDKLKTGEAKYGLDLDLIVGRESALVQSDNDWTEAETAAIPYTLADGALLDVSFKGGAITINRKKNQAVYGPDATPEAILNGQVPAPEEFAPLYKLLEELSVVAPVELED
jgi:lipid-binding SYLF domain-containing protein